MFYGLPSDLGIGYSYDYDVTYTNSAFEDRFFGTLSDLADPAPRTLYQQDYNAQNTNVLNVRQNHFIDAPTVEQWLIDNAPYGVDTTQDTLFFINWWGRDDFKFHLYTEDRRARSGHRLQLRHRAREPQGDRLGRHDRRRRRERLVARHPSRLVLRPVRRSRIVDRQLERGRRRPGRQRRARLPHAGRLGVPDAGR